MRRLLAAWIASMLLVAPVLSHEGGRHASLRDGKPDEVVETSTVENNGRQLTVELKRWPSQPATGDQIGILVTLREHLPTPDPLLGDTLPVEAQLSLQTPVALAFHAEVESGNYGLDWRPTRAGRYRLGVAIRPADGEPFTVEHAVDVGYSARGRQLRLAGGAALVATLLCVVLPWGSLARRLVATLPFSVVGLGLLALAPGLADPPSPAMVEPAVSTQTSDQVRVEPALQTQLEIRVEPARLGRFQQSLELPATVIAPPGKAVPVVAPADGVVTTLLAFPGQRVSAGQSLAVLEEHVSASERTTVSLQRLALETSRQDLSLRRQEQALRLQSLHRELQEASYQSDLTHYQQQQAEQLYGLEVMSRQDLMKARSEADQARVRQLGLAREYATLKGRGPAPKPVPAPAESINASRQLTAPISGVVTEVKVGTGEQVVTGQILASLLDSREVWVQALIPEVELMSARQSQVAEVVAPGQNPVSARRVWLSPQLDPETRTARANYRVANPEGGWLINMSATIKLLGSSQKALLISREAVLDYSDGQGRVFVQVQPDLFEPRRVTLRDGGGPQLVVTQGLRPGDRVVVQGASQLDAELQRRAPEQGV